MKNLFKGLSAIFAVVPGGAVLLLGVTVPAGYKLVFGGMVEALCCAVILFVYIYRTRVESFGSRKLIRNVRILAIAFVASLTLYLITYNWCVYTDDYTRGVAPHAEPGDYTVVYPIILTGNVAKLVEASGGRQEAIDEHLASQMNQYARANSVIFSLTIILMSVFYTGIFLSLTSAFSVLAVRAGITSDLMARDD